MQIVLNHIRNRFWPPLLISICSVAVILTLAHLTKISFWQAALALTEQPSAEVALNLPVRPKMSYGKAAMLERILGPSIKDSRVTSQLTTSQWRQLMYWADTVEILETRLQSGWGKKQPLRIQNESLPFAVSGQLHRLNGQDLVSALKTLGQRRVVVSETNEREFHRAQQRLLGGGLYLQQTPLNLKQIAFVYLASEEKLVPGRWHRLLTAIKVRLPVSPDLRRKLSRVLQVGASPSRYAQ